MRKGVDFHHSGSLVKEDQQVFHSINEYHKRRWKGKTKSKMGFYGGYHFLIERNGSVGAYRGIEEVGAHNKTLLPPYRNYTAIGICFAGNMTVQDLTNAQILSAVDLVQRLIDQGKVDETSIKGHRHWKATQCPGNRLPDNIWQYLQERAVQIREELAKKTPSIVKWHKKHKIIEKWSESPTPEELKQGWIAYKILKAIKEGRVAKMKFPF